MAKKFVQKPYPIYVLTPEAIFYDIRQFLLNTNHKLACSLKMDQALTHDIDYQKLLNLLEQRYGVSIPEEAGFKAALTVKDFCELCAKVINKKCPADLSDVLYFIKYILVASTDLNKCDITNTSKMSRSFIPWKKSLKLDDLDRLQTIMDLGKIYGVKIEETDTIKKANTLIEFAEACRSEINRNVKTQKLSITSDYSKTIDKIQSNIIGEKPQQQTQNVISYTYENIETAIKRHLEKEYNRYGVTPKNNWYKNLGLSDFQRCVFFEWVEKTFEMKLPYFYFENMDSLYKAIYYTKLGKDSFMTRVREFLGRTK